jgi:AraC family transcriptional regulator
MSKTAKFMFRWVRWPKFNTFIQVLLRYSQVMENGSLYMQLGDGASPVVDGKDRMYYCTLHQYHSNNVFRNFSIKYTLEGIVEYRTEKQSYSLLPNQFLLSSKQPCECIVDSKPLTRNLSIDIAQQTMEEVFTVMSAREEIDLENLEAGHFTSPDFFENIYPAGISDLGKYLVSLGQHLQQDPSASVSLSSETFYELAEKVVLHEIQSTKALNQLVAVKSATRKETLRRVLSGKYYMDAYYLHELSIPQIARQANLSQYYFFRNFKKAFAITPYQYLLEKRLDHARKLIHQDMTIQDAAFECCFPDAFTFSKAFKRKFGFPPSDLKKMPQSI